MSSGLQWSSVRFLNRYYRTALERYEGLDVEHADRAQLFAMAEEAAALRRILLDYIDEGYTAFVDELVAGTDALRRLQAILDAALPRLGPGSERDHFNLYPEAVRLELPEPDQGGEVIELGDYLAGLVARSAQEPDLARHFDDPARMRHWLARTDVLMTEMVDYLLWVAEHLSRRPGLVPVTLLRDTLLLYVGLQWLHRRGEVARAPRPLFLSRRFVKALPESDKSYVTLVSEVLYAILLDAGQTDLASLRPAFVARALAHPDISEAFKAASGDYLAALDLEGPPLLLEAGWHGTFPLWVLSLTGNRGDLLLYSTSPWLYPVYRDIVYTGNCNNLRDFETIVLHDKLFQFESYADGRVMVRESASEAARDLALYELKRFLAILETRFFNDNGGAP